MPTTLYLSESRSESSLIYTEVFTRGGIGEGGEESCYLGSARLLLCFEALLQLVAGIQAVTLTGAREA